MSHRLVYCHVLHSGVRRGKCVRRKGHELCGSNVPATYQNIPVLQSMNVLRTRGNLYTYVTGGNGKPV